jgi:Arc/MetJ family transcription regulator
VYFWFVARTTVDLDDESCQAVMRRYHLTSAQDAVNLALRMVAGGALSIHEAKAMRGSGWTGDLEALRTTHV